MILADNRRLRCQPNLSFRARIVAEQVQQGEGLRRPSAV
jgi:hypothetical protein